MLYLFYYRADVGFICVEYDCLVSVCVCCIAYVFPICVYYSYYTQYLTTYRYYKKILFLNIGGVIGFFTN